MSGPPVPSCPWSHQGQPAYTTPTQEQQRKVPHSGSKAGGQGAEKRKPMRRELTENREPRMARQVELTNQQIREQNSTSLKVVSQLSIDCHQVSPIYNCCYFGQLSASLRLELSNVPVSQGLEHKASSELRQAARSLDAIWLHIIPPPGHKSGSSCLL